MRNFGIRDYRGFVKYKLASYIALIKSINYDIKDTIVVAGTPRSGTTWVAEVLNLIPHTCILYEPLHLDRVPQAKQAGFTWRTKVDPDANWPQGEAFLRQALTGKITNPWILSKSKLLEVVRNEHWLVKLIQANRMLPWMAKKFPTRTPILVIRHPCAVISSQLSVKMWPGRSHIDLAKQWCRDYLILTGPKPHPWHLVFYEKLVRGGMEEFSHIFNRLGFEVPNGLERALNRPSSTTRPDSPIRQGRNPLTAWKSHLTGRQVEDIFAVTREYGLDFYEEEGETIDDRP